jgi:hypothetical protein
MKEGDALCQATDSSTLNPSNAAATVQPASRCKHCWHGGSEMDSSCYSSKGGYSETHLLCCHCGETRTHIEEWGPPSDPKKHGPHSWVTRRSCV